jgi:hypothetical protein
MLRQMTKAVRRWKMFRLRGHRSSKSLPEPMDVLDEHVLCVIRKVTVQSIVL